MNSRLARKALAALAGGAAALCSCSTPREARAGYVPIADVERVYGPLIGAGNHPTPDQHGNGERVGLFREARGTIWGLPLSLDGSAVLVCAPETLRGAEVTGHLPAGATIIAFTNQPTGWRGGAGNLELLFRDAGGAVHGQVVQGADFPPGPACWAPDSPGPSQRLRYYRLAP